MAGASVPSVVLTKDEVADTLQQFEERADHLDLDLMGEFTELGEEAEGWVTSLTAPGAKLLVGPRGCGKTHLMRYAYLQCIKNEVYPLGVYANFNRYYRLEPLLRKRGEAISLFYSWVLANTMLGIFNASNTLAAAECDFDYDPSGHLGGISREVVESIIGTLERGLDLDVEQQSAASGLTIDRVKSLLLLTAERFGRKRVVLLLDDAALTLAPEFMSHFFDIFRALKGARIAPKASVYPATTEYGSSFHVSHEAESVFVWKKVTDENYQQFMQGIAQKRFPALVSQMPAETRQLLAYAAFGVPRSYMALARNFDRVQAAAPATATVQQSFNRVVSEFCSEKEKEYRSLAGKAPVLETIIGAGMACFHRIVEVVSHESKDVIDAQVRQITLGVQADGLTNTYVRRMFELLQEAGMVYKSGRVSHGDREYERFIPHLAALIDSRAFSRSGGFSPKLAVEILSRPDEKHPVRRSIQKLVEPDVLRSLKLDLPNCDACGMRRAEGARYCHNCGAPLTDSSTYELCMNTPLIDVPGLTSWQRTRLGESAGIPQTVGQFLALQDKGTALRTVRQIGRKRAETVIDAVETFVDEFLS